MPASSSRAVFNVIDADYDLALPSDALVAFGNVALGQLQVTPQHRPIHINNHTMTAASGAECCGKCDARMLPPESLSAPAELYCVGRDFADHSGTDATARSK